MSDRGGGLCSTEVWLVAEVLKGRGSLNDPLRVGGGLDLFLVSIVQLAAWVNSTGLESDGFLGGSLGFNLVVEGDAAGFTSTSAVDVCVVSTGFAAEVLGFVASGFSVGDPGVSSGILVGDDFPSSSGAAGAGSPRPESFCSASFWSFGCCEGFFAPSSSRSACWINSSWSLGVKCPAFTWNREGRVSE